MTLDGLQSRPADLKKEQELVVFEKIMFHD
jgi:hypothetical protein